MYYKVEGGTEGRKEEQTDLPLLDSERLIEPRGTDAAFPSNTSRHFLDPIRTEPILEHSERKTLFRL